MSNNTIFAGRSAKLIDVVLLKPKLPSQDCVIAVTKRVNGGTNGLDDRLAQAKVMFKALGLA